eukprot:gene19982-biopygen11025
MGEVEAALGVGEQRAALLHVRHLGLQQQAAFRHSQVFGVPLGVALGEAQAQGVVMFQHRQQRLLQAMRFQGLNRLQQQCLVPVLALRDVGVEEPVLDRRQPGRAGQHALFGADLLAAGRHGGQGLHGLVLEQITRTEMNPRLPGPADHLDRQDRVAAQLEEVVGDAHALHLQHISPDLCQQLLVTSTAGNILAALEFRLRQGLAIQLAVGRDRQRRHADDLGGHHVIRQLRAQVRLEAITDGHAIGRHHITDQLLARRTVTGDHQRVTDIVQLPQARLDFPQFNAKAPDLDLVVNTPDVIKHTINTLAYQVAAAVETIARRPERVRHKALGTQVRTTVIAAGNALATDVELTGNPRRQRVEVFVQHVQRALADSTPDRRIGSLAPGVDRDLPEHRRDHGFGGAIAVGKELWTQCRFHLFEGLVRHRIATEAIHPYRGWFLLAMGRVLRQLLEVGRRETGNRDAVLMQGVEGLLRCPQAGIADHQRAPAQ